MKEGESLEMTATVSGNPQPTVKWILEEEEVEAMDENVQVRGWWNRRFNRSGPKSIIGQTNK